MLRLICLFLTLCLLSPAAQDAGLELSPTATIHEVTEIKAAPGPRVLCVVAHPDDEVAFAATLYKTATFLKGVCDVVVITNGEGGFKYSTLAEPIYGIELTDEAVGRKRLPAIRRTEQIAGCRIMRVRRLYALNQRDHRYTLDPGEVLDPKAKVWNLAAVRHDLGAILNHGRYDFVLTHLPVPTTHGHHQAATVLALEAAAGLTGNRRPVVLGADDPAANPPSVGLENYPLTRLNSEAGPFAFSRAERFGYLDQLSYQIIVNWVIAEHKSQGTMQLAMNKNGEETYWLYASNPADAAARTRAYFEKLTRPQFKAKRYGPSAGVR